MPGIIEGAKDGKGRGKQVIAGKTVLWLAVTHVQIASAHIVFTELALCSSMVLVYAIMIFYVHPSASQSVGHIVVL